MNLLGILLAYLIGSIPTSVWIGRFFHGVDVREFGSRNAGATNTFRVLGKKTGIPVLILDVLKGYIAVNLAFYTGYFIPGTERFTTFQLLLGFFAVIGHIFPVFAGFRGGKGIATLLGIVLYMNFDAALYCLGIFMIVFLGTRYVSLSSMIAGLAYPVIMIVIFEEKSQSIAMFSILISIMILITHQKNIERLIRKQESRAILYKLKRKSFRIFRYRE